jgi:hypothetical protein
MTPQERECINELLEAATINGVSIEAAARSIGEVMLNLTALGGRQPLKHAPSLNSFRK